jgi:hypothetical protein
VQPLSFLLPSPLRTQRVRQLIRGLAQLDAG